VDGEEFTFGVSGKLWRDALVLYDRQTDSLWSQVDGRAFRGDSSGRVLKHVPSVQTTWGEWKRLHPETLVLRKDGEYDSSRYTQYWDDPDRVGVFGNETKDLRLEPKREIIGVRAGTGQLALPLDRLRALGWLDTEVGGEPVVLFVDPETDGVHAYSRSLNHEALTFTKRIEKNGRTYLRSKPRGLWDPRTGTAIEGKLKGKRLEEISVTRVFWFAWSAFFPATEVWIVED
jgi:hypothetical protein